MWCLSPGERSSPRNLDAMLCEYRDELNDDIAARRERAELAEAPTDGLDPLPAYEPDEDLATVNVVFRAVERKRHLQILNHIANLDEADSTGGERLIAVDELEREFLAVAVAGVHGLVDEDGAAIAVEAKGTEPLSEEQLERLHAAGLLPSLFTTAKRFQLLRGQKKRLYGRLPLTADSAAATATSARSGSAHPGDATAEQPHPSGREPSTKTPPAPAATH